ncbi:MAG: TlpA family protein disulfide reductase [Planctomycetota bacterium]|jgi:cytochrome oxidase Cu insertion factor (SCO1/SenC/PrrC family)
MKRSWAFWGMVVSGAVVLLAAGGLWWFAVKLRPGVALATLAPAVSFEDADGRAVTLASLEGQVVLLDFWSST